MEKRCSKCKEVKPITEFTTDINRRDGYYPQCKQCRAEYSRNKYLIHKERILLQSKEYYDNNKSSIADRHKRWYLDNKDAVTDSHKKYYEDNKESILLQDKQYYEENKTRILAYQKQYKRDNKEKINKWRRSHTVESQQWRFTNEAYKWKLAVYARDNYTCQHCGKNHCKIHAHHIKPAKDFEDLRFDISNGICLCVECHKKQHSYVI
jgi:hypothetical protein